MASERQRQANRRNGQKGGPKTETGKQHSRLNSLQHGLTSSTLVVLPEENQHEYEAVLRGFRESFQPNDATEDALVLRLAHAHWRSLRARRVETGMLDITAATERARAREIVEECPEHLDPHNAVAVAFMTRPADQWHTYLRYDTTIARDFFRTLNALTKLQRARQHRQPPPLLAAAAGAQLPAAGVQIMRQDFQPATSVSDSGIRSVSQNSPVHPDLEEQQKLTHESKQQKPGHAKFGHERAGKLQQHCPTARKSSHCAQSTPASAPPSASNSNGSAIPLPVDRCHIIAYGASAMRILSLLLLAATVSAQQIHTLAIGHEFRQDDSPTIATAPDGSAWAAWLSFVGDRDDVVIRQYKDNKWGALQWVPGTSGDSWLPQVAIDKQNRVWVVWSQQANGNWDLYARRFDPAAQEWSALERLTHDPLPDINPRIASDGNGRIAVAWQGFRNGQSDIFLKTLDPKTLDGDRPDKQPWGPDVRVSQHAANEWEPSLAYDRSGNLWVAYDSYRAGNYDVFLTKVAGGNTRGDEIAVTASPRFEARATVAIDGADRVWVAWEEGLEGWGKDQGYILRDRKTGVPLGGVRRPRIRCYDAGQSRDTEDSLEQAFAGAANTYQPHVFADPKGGVWVVAKSRRNIPDSTPVNPNRVTGYFEYGLTRFDGRSWSKAQPLPNSRGRSSTRVSGGALSDGTLLLVWPTDNRAESFNHRPLRQQVYAAAVPPPAPATGPQWRSPVEQQTPGGAAPSAHPNEAADVKSIRAYRTKINGKDMRIVRGDFHRHTELSWDGGGTVDGNLQDFYRYMIDAASMDFGASTDHQGGAWPYWWWYTQKMTDMYHVPGAYVPVFGYERSAVFPNGHRNIFFAKRSDSRVTPFHLRAGAQGFQVPAAPIGDEPGIGSGDLVSNDTKLLYEDIRSRNAVAISHTSGTRMGTDWRDNDPDLEPVVEIFQGARTNYEQLGAPFVAEESKDAPHMKQAGYQPEGMVSNAWAKGYKLGIITSSDHGSTHISYAMVYTGDPSRQGVLDAIRKRHTYGATDNIVLEVRMGKYFMGDEFALNKPEPIRVKVRGTGKVAKVEIIKDSKIIYATEPKTQDVSFEFTDRGEVSGRHYYYVRVQQEDQMIAWSSPFFINYP